MGFRHLYISIFKTGLLLGLVLIVNQLKSQSVIRQSLSSLGGSYSVNGITIQSTTGQASSTTNIIHAKGSLIQGFIQPPFQSKIYAKTFPTALIYPNPSTGLFHIKMQFEAGDYFVVNNILGTKIYDKNISSNFVEQTFNLEGNSEGVYTITIYRENKTIQTTKIVLAK